MQADHVRLIASRSGPRCLIFPWSYRHLRFVAGLHVVLGVLLVFVGTLLLGHSSSWGAGLLAAAAAHFAYAYWELRIARSAAPQA